MNNFVQHIDVELKIRHRVILPSSPIFMSLIKRMPEIVTIKHNHESTCSLPLWKKILASWLMSLPLLGQGTGSYSIHEGDSSRDQLMARLGWKRERERKLKSPSGSAYSPVHPPFLGPLIAVASLNFELVRVAGLDQAQSFFRSVACSWTTPVHSGGRWGSTPRRWGGSARGGCSKATTSPTTSAV